MMRVMKIRMQKANSLSTKHVGFTSSCGTPCISTSRQKPHKSLPVSLLRRLAQDLSHPLITMLQQECTRATCPEMKAGEWMYLCVAHGNDGAMEASLVRFHREKKRKERPVL